MTCVSCDLATVSRQPLWLLGNSMLGRITVSNLLSDPPDEATVAHNTGGKP